MWSKQFYEYSVRDWLIGDPAMPPPPPERLHGRNCDWEHVHAENVLSMPDTWEYPWFAAWDLSFHCVALSLVDPDFAKHQLLLLTREWYMHPNGQLPAYEWAFGDVNPPVQAWAALRMFQIERKMTGRDDYGFLERVFQKLLLNFTWWVNRKDAQGRNVFQGGFLGLDNIGVFDRGAPLPGGGHLDQSDGTSWMGVYHAQHAGDRARTRAEVSRLRGHRIEVLRPLLADRRRDEQDRRRRPGLWDEEDGFYYDYLHANGESMPLRIRSVVGLIPLFAVEVFDAAPIRLLPEFAKRVRWFQRNRPDLLENVAHINHGGIDDRRLMAFVDKDRLVRILHAHARRDRVLEPVRHSLALALSSRAPILVSRSRAKTTASTTSPPNRRPGLFGGNSNWRGPIWFPINYSPDRGAAEIPLLLRRRFQGRVSDRIGQHADALGGRRRSSRTA